VKLGHRVDRAHNASATGGLESPHAYCSVGWRADPLRGDRPGSAHRSRARLFVQLRRRLAAQWLGRLLVGEGRQVIGLDCRGHGNSGKPHSPQAYAGNRIPDDVLAVMDAAGIERADIMGYSMGALVTLNLLPRHAKRFTSVVVGGVGLPKPTTDPQRRARLAAALEAADPATISEPTALRFRQALERRGNDLLALAAFQRSERTQAEQAELRRLGCRCWWWSGTRTRDWSRAAAGGGSGRCETGHAGRRGSPECVGSPRLQAGRRPLPASRAAIPGVIGRLGRRDRCAIESSGLSVFDATRTRARQKWSTCPPSCRRVTFPNTGAGEHDLLAKTRRKRRSACAV
jgi:pimeloyl-ACP methyl ester carboxylesterase